jgi:hypothetical protein
MQLVAKFPLGRLAATPDALEAMEASAAGDDGHRANLLPEEY